MITFKEFITESKLDDAKKFNDDWTKIIPGHYKNGDWSIIKNKATKGKWLVQKNKGATVIDWPLRKPFNSFDDARIAVNQYVYDQNK